jgi:hypothetical protein
MVIDISKLSQAISDELKLYNSDVIESLKKVNDECTKEFVANTRKDAPKGNRKKGHYYTYISSKTIMDTPNEKVNLWYVRNPKYRLTHLLKDGHKIKNKPNGRVYGTTKSNDFLNKNYDILEKEYLARAKETIQNGR